MAEKYYPPVTQEAAIKAVDNLLKSYLKEYSDNLKLVRIIQVFIELLAEIKDWRLLKEAINVQCEVVKIFTLSKDFPRKELPKFKEDLLYAALMLHLAVTVQKGKLCGMFKNQGPKKHHLKIALENLISARNSLDSMTRSYYHVSTVDHGDVVAKEEQDFLLALFASKKAELGGEDFYFVDLNKGMTSEEVSLAYTVSALCLELRVSTDESPTGEPRQLTYDYFLLISGGFENQYKPTQKTETKLLLKGG